MTTTKTSFTSPHVRPDSLIMYVDMNSYFASCEQQANPNLRGRPIGVTAGDKPYACIIAPSVEAKRMGIKTGMRLNEARQLCPALIGIPANPVLYREKHIAVMKVLRSYCDDVLPKSIDEAAMNLTTYRRVYTDVKALAIRIKLSLREAVGACVTCSIGIAPNTFLAKLATDFQKPDGLVEITLENLDECLARITLIDLPGIGHRNQRRLEMVGIQTPLQMRHSSPSILRRAFGGVNGNYWHSRLNGGEVDYHQSGQYRSMSATRMLSPEQRGSYEKLDAMLISLCTRLEQRLVTSCMFCRHITFFIRYQNAGGWQMQASFGNHVQDAMEMRLYILDHMQAYETKYRSPAILGGLVQQMGVTISGFAAAKEIQYGLFDNRMRDDTLRAVVYGIKGRWGKYAVRKGAELVQRSRMQDAIGFGSVRDFVDVPTGEYKNFLLEEMDE